MRRERLTKGRIFDRKRRPTRRFSRNLRLELFKKRQENILTTEATHACWLLSFDTSSAINPKMTERKQRKPNWTDEEMGVLAEEYASSIRIIRGKLSPVITSDTKRRVWEMINQK